MTNLRKGECVHGYLKKLRMCKTCNPIKYEINKEMVFSSTHIPESTARALEEGTVSFSVYANDYSWRIHAAPTSAVHQDNDNKELVALAKIAKEHDCIWLVIDSDGPEYINLQIFDW